MQPLAVSQVNQEEMYKIRDLCTGGRSDLLSPKHITVKPYLGQRIILPHFTNPKTNEKTDLRYLSLGSFLAKHLGITVADETAKMEAAMLLSEYFGDLPIVVGVTVDRETRYLKNGKYFGRPDKTRHVVLDPSELVSKEDILEVPIVEEGLELIDDLYSEV